MSSRRRYDHASELRAFARQVEELPNVTHRVSPEGAVNAKVDLAKAMYARANELVRMDEPNAESVFRSGRGESARGRPFRAETRSRVTA